MSTNPDFQKPEYWQNLFIQLNQSSDPSQITRVINEVSNLKIHEPSSDILRLTFLSEFYKQEEHIRIAGLRAAYSAGLSVDALSAFASLYCISALKLRDKESFLGAINNAQLPKVVSRLNRIALECIQGKMKVRAPQKLERIMIITSYFGNTFHTPSVLAVNYASALNELGIKTSILTCQELLPHRMTQYHGAGRHVMLPALDASGWPKLIPKGIMIARVDESLDMPSRWASALNIVLQFDPDLILCVGPFSPLASALYSFRPVVALPTNAVSFMGCADIWLRGSDHMLGDAEMTWGHEFPLPLAYSHPFRISKKIKDKSLTRKQLGIAHNALVLVTVGFRLKSEIAGDWADQMLDTISKFDQLVWVIIGGATPSALEKAPHGKIINLGGRDDVSSVLQLCDIYVNPPRMGGGFSVIEAMSAGLATVAFCNTDGGEKIGQYASRDQGMYFAQLLELIKNQDKRIDMGEQLKKRFTQYYDIESSAPSLMGACRAAIDHARKRLTHSF